MNTLFVSTGKKTALKSIFAETVFLKVNSAYKNKALLAKRPYFGGQRSNSYPLGSCPASRMVSEL